MPPGGWLGSGADEGRAKLRKAPGRRREPLIRGCPNGNSCPVRGAPVSLRAEGAGTP